MLSCILSRSLRRATARAGCYRTSRKAAASTAVQRHQDEFWRRVPVYENVPAGDFLSYRWSIRNTVQGKVKLWTFLNAVVPEEVPHGLGTQRRQEFVEDVFKGIDASAMAVRITPYVLSRIDWTDPRSDPILRQFLPLKSAMLPDHPKLTFDSLHETADMPVPGLVHRYPEKALFLATAVCPTNCTFCTRSYGVGADTDALKKTPFKPTKRRWDAVFEYIKARPELKDIVVSGGDSFYLEPDQVRLIGERLIAMPHIRRFRFASKGLAVAPGRFLDRSDGWAAALASVTKQARKAGKSVALHTHFNHPNEISWITQEAAQQLFEASVPVRNQTVLLKGVNDDLGTMSRLITRLADNNITPYYIYMCDMVKTNEHLRTPLKTMLDLETQITGSVAGFMTPKFVVDLPGGGGKRAGHSYISYNVSTGISRFEAPAVTEGDGNGSRKPRVFEYHDPTGTHTDP